MINTAAERQRRTLSVFILSFSCDPAKFSFRFRFSIVRAARCWAVGLRPITKELESSGFRKVLNAQFSAL